MFDPQASEALKPLNVGPSSKSHEQGGRQPGRPKELHAKPLTDLVTRQDAIKQDEIRKALGRLGENPDVNEEVELGPMEIGPSQGIKSDGSQSDQLDKLIQDMFKKDGGAKVLEVENSEVALANKEHKGFIAKIIDTIKNFFNKYFR